MSPSPKCLVRGSVNIDEFFHLPHIVRPGETISSTSLTRGAGGKGANQALAAARAGGDVVLEGYIGEDGTWVREMLKENGVDVGRLEVLQDEVTGRAVIQSSADGENSIILHKGANYHLPQTSTPSLSPFTHIILQNEIDPSITTSYLLAAHKSSLVSIYNPSPMPSPSELRAFPWSSLTWLIVNEGELGDLLDAFGVEHDDTADLRGKAEKELQALHECKGFDKGVNVICTLGAQGIIYFSPGVDGVKSRSGYLPAAKVLNGVKDTTGAGDCFAGYFAAGLMRGEDLELALQTCLTACAMCVEKPGAMESVPWRKDVEARRA